MKLYLHEPMLQRMTDLGAATGAALSIGAAHVIALTNDVPIPSATTEDFIRWALKESALLVVVLVILFFYRRDFKNRGKTDQALVRESVQVNTELKGQVSRLARAIEDMNRRHRSTDTFNDPEDESTQRRRG